MSNKKSAVKKSGSALFTVVCVMSIMLVVVMTTMAMVSIAYTRALQDYTSSQSYVVAKNTLDMLVETGDNSTITYDYGQSSLSDAQISDLNQPLYDVMMQASSNFSSGSPVGGEVRYGTIGELPATFGSCRFVDLSGSNQQIKYEVLPDPNPAGSSYNWDFDGDGVTDDTTSYGEQRQSVWAINAITGKEEQKEYMGCRVKLTVSVESGVTESEQVRTVSRIFDSSYVRVYERTPSTPPSPGVPGGGPFTQAIQTVGTYAGGTGGSILGGLSAKGGGGSFDGLKGTTSSIYINGNFDPKDSGHNGTIDIGAGQSITINGTFSVTNNFNFNSTYDPSTDTESRPFIYCDEIDWQNGNIPVGTMDVIAVDGGVFGRDSNSISGNVVSGGDMTFKGQNMVLSGAVYVDGDIDFSNASAFSSTSNGIIYVSGSYPSNIPAGITVVEKDPGFLDNIEVDYGTSSTTGNVDPTTGIAKISIPSSPVTTYSVSTDSSVFGRLYEDGNTGGTLVSPETQSGTSINEEGADQTVDATASPITISAAEDTVTNVYLPAGTYSDLEIVVSGGGKVNILQDGDVTLQGVKVWSDVVKAKVESGEVIDMKTLADDPGYSLIEWYAAAGTTLSVNASASGDGNLLNAYIYGPEADFETVNGTPNGPTIRVKDEFGNESTLKTCMLGSVIANNVSLCNGGAAIVYINPNGTSSGGGTIGGTPGTPAGPSSAASTTFDLQQGAQLYTNRD